MALPNFQMPESIELDESTYTNTYGKFIVQPLERGYGNTIGNSLRRVLLSSIPGVAITMFRVEGILHEFSSIPGVLEDVSEIILNMKQVRVKTIEKRPDKVVLDLKGPGEFKAGDIQSGTSEFEVLNPDLHIATLNEDADFQMDLRIGKGRGYIPAEENKSSDMPVGTIPIDSIYSPVVRVNYNVENTRVGQRTDYEKLTLEIHTDGTLPPDDALSYAGKILRDHIQLFIGFDVEQEEEDSQDVDEEVLRIRRLLEMGVDELELSVRSHNCLTAANINTIGDLVCKDEQEMLKFRNFGRKSLNELNKVLEEKGLHFGMDIDKYLENNEE
ncbi:MAG: DNA-directed RNA polymerase subunit alpha [candidate division KSB1 bacterium]|nr:DNA-directed RNA polymerase subunit alpha [candidate division KSB1 bacterium]